MISVLTHQMSRSLATIRETNERNWKKIPIIVNSYHVYMDNAINIPMVMFSYPLYHLGLESLNYGAIGTLLGHELTHGFDNIGRFYDKHGNFLRWWSIGNAAIFTDKTKCFIQQYNDYALPNTTRRTNGLRTLNENLADNGGLHTAYLAYKHLRETDGPEKRLPGFENYTSDQLFFLAFANSWCQTQSPEFLAKQIQTDIHSPNFARILGTLQNSDEFASAFNCPAGSPMNPERTKCRIW